MDFAGGAVHSCEGEGQVIHVVFDGGGVSSLQLGGRLWLELQNIKKTQWQKSIVTQNM